MSILVNENSRVLVQGITGREGSFHAERCQAYGTNLVAGVTPGKGGQALATPPLEDEIRNSPAWQKREMSDIDTRLSDATAMGVDVQVIYPTLFIAFLTHDVELEVALARSYNRFMADACSRSEGRMRWVVVPALRDLDKTIEELHYGKEHGAVGVLFRGVEKDRSLAEPYFFPIYEEAARLDMPICIHTGTGNPPGSGADAGGRFNAISAFTELAMSDIPERYPELRTGWIETGASWVPFLQADLAAKAQKLTFHPFDYKTELFDRYRFYVACDTTDDIAYILKFASEDSLMIGTDYTHADQSAELRALDGVERMGDEGAIPPGVAKKMLDANPRRFYGI